MVLGNITVNNKNIVELADRTNENGATTLSRGSLALGVEDDFTAYIYTQYLPEDDFLVLGPGLQHSFWTGIFPAHLYLNSTGNWVSIKTINEQLSQSTVENGAYLTVPSYYETPSSSKIKGATLFNLGVATQSSRSAALVYTIPNPGNAVTSANFVLTEGAQTINGEKSFTGEVICQSGLTVNGDLTFANTIDVDVSRFMVTLNKGGTSGSSAGAGIEIEENSVIAAYILTDDYRYGIEFKVPANDYKLRTGVYDNGTLSTATFTYADADGVIVVATPPTNSFDEYLASWAGNGYGYDNTVYGSTVKYASNSLGINVASPTANFDIDSSCRFQDRILLENGSENYRAKQQILQWGCTTTNNLPAYQYTSYGDINMPQIDVPVNSTVIVEAHILASNLGSGGSFIRTCTFTRGAGGFNTIQMVKAQSDYTSKDNSLLSASLAMIPNVTTTHSTGSCTSNVVTLVTSSAHGLSVGQSIDVTTVISGNVLSGSYQVSAIPTSTSFSFVLPVPRDDIPSASASGSTTGYGSVGVKVQGLASTNINWSATCFVQTIVTA